MQKYLILLSLAAFPALAAPSFQCRPVGIADGDTFTCLTENKTPVKLRMGRIDAPEKSQAYGQASRKMLSSLIWGKTVTVHPYQTDRYGRMLVSVTADGIDVNKKMVETGYAWAYRQYLKKGEAPEYLRLEESARAAKRGLWAEPDPVYPSDYRREKRNRW